MSHRTIRRLAAVLLAFAATSAQAAITCSLSSGGFAAAYDPANPATNVTQTSFTVSCTRGLAGDPTSVAYSVTVDNGLSPQGQNNRASYLANRIRYDSYRDAACSSKWKGATAVGGTINFVGTGTVTQTANFWGCIIAGQTGLPAGTYLDTVIMTMTYGAAPALTAVNSFGVAIGTPATCSIGSPPGTLTFNYLSLGPAISPGTTFGITCTMALAYTMALDVTTGTLVGLNYSLALSTPSSTGTGVQQTHSINGTMAAGQAGTCAAGTCTGSRVHALTITY